MSLTGEANKYVTDLKAAVRAIALESITDREGALLGTKKTMGYVCKIHTEGDLAGTVDVQEYGYSLDGTSSYGEGHHEGVMLSAIQDNNAGYLLVPMLFSDVIIAQNPIDRQEYVLMYSHIQRIQLQATCAQCDETADISIGVTEVEPFNEIDGDIEKDYKELEPTENKTSTIYTAKSISHSVVSPDDKEGFTEKTTATGKVIKIKNTTITIDGDSVVIETDGNIKVKSQSAKVESSSCEIKGNMVTVTGGQLKVAGTATPDMNGPFNPIKVCPFSGAPHCGSIVSGT